MRRFFEYAMYLFLVLVFSMTVISVISRMYQFWDVGSNSWIDRLKGDGWEFQRGAATVEQALNGHKIAHQVKATILKEMPQILEVLVHIEPEEELLNQTDASIVEKNPQ